MRRLIRFLFLMAVISAASTGMSACGDDGGGDDEDVTSDVEDAEDMADTEEDGVDMVADADASDTADDVDADVTTETGELRMIHLSPDGPAVDVFANGMEPAAISALAFPTGTPYIELPTASYTFDVAPAGMGVDESVLNVADFTVEADTRYTVAAIDDVANLTALPLIDDDTDIAAGSFRVRAIHAAPEVGQVDIWDMTNPGSPALLYENVDFGAAGDATDLPAGQYNLGIDTDDDGTPDLAFELPDLSEGVYVNLFAANDDGGAVFLIAQLPDGSTIRIDPSAASGSLLRVLHLSPDAPNVDVYLNQGSMPALSDLEYSNSSAYLAVTPDVYQVDVTATGDPVGDAVLTAQDVALEEDLSYTVVAYDKLANISALVLKDDNSDPGADTIRIRAVHAAADVGQVDIWNIPVVGDPTELYTDLDFGVAGAAMDLPAGQYNLGADVDNDTVPDLIFELPDLAAGSIANVFAVSEDASTVYLLVQLSDGTTTRVDPAPARFMGLHLSPDTGGVDVFLDGDATAVATDVTFPNGTGYLDITPGNHAFDVAPTGAGIGASVISLADVALGSAEKWTGAAIGESTGMPVTLDVITLETERFGVPAGNVRLRGIHAAPALGMVDIWDTTDPNNPVQLYNNVSFGEVESYVEVPAGAYTLGIDTGNDGVPEAEFDTGMLAEGTVAEIFAISDDMGALSLIVQFADGTITQIMPNP